MSTTFEYSDCGNKRTTVASLATKADFTPLDLEIEEQPTSIHLEGASATVNENGAGA